MNVSNIALLALALAVFVAGALYFIKPAAPPFGSSEFGSRTTFATSSNPTVSSTVNSAVFATSSCLARIITTYASPIMFTLNDAIPTGVVGHLQAASTTVAYDSGQYGCGAVRIYSFASQAISVSEER